MIQHNDNGYRTTQWLVIKPNLSVTSIKTDGEWHDMDWETEYKIIYGNISHKMCTQFGCVLFFCGYSMSYGGINTICLPIYFKVASLALGQ